LDALFTGVTFLGDEHFFVAFFPLLYWCVDAAGALLGFLFLGSRYLSLMLKDLFVQPRRSVLEPGISIVEARGYGLPSNHPQAAVVVWGFVASRLRCGWAWAAAGLILYRTWNPVKLPGSVWQRLARIPIGIVGIGIIYLGLAAIDESLFS
jgi:hypothetical protein